MEYTSDTVAPIMPKPAAGQKVGQEAGKSHAAAFAPPALAAGQLPSLIGMDRNELQAAMIGLGLEKFRAKQVWQWVYEKGVRDFDEMKTLGKSARELLATAYTLERPRVAKDLKSADGTRKWLLAM